MKLFKKLFSNSKGREVQDEVRSRDINESLDEGEEIVRNATKSAGDHIRELCRIIELNPHGKLDRLFDIARSVIIASECCWGINKVFILNEEQNSRLQSIILPGEFLFFFMHLMNRRAYALYGDAKRKILQKFVTPFIVDTVVGTYFKYIAEEEQIRLDFYDTLNDRENDYATSAEMLPPNHPPYFSGDSLISKLFRHISDEVGDDTLTMMLHFLPSVTQTIVELDLDTLLLKASDTLASLENDSSWSLSEYQENISEWMDGRNPE